jgi:Short C-terminal domain
MGLLGMVARTTVVAGTATVVSNRVSRRQANRWAQQDAAQQPQYAQAPPPQYAQAPPQYVQAPPPAPPAPAPPVDTVAQLKGLAELRDQGILTDAEFDAQKAKILAS